MGDGRFELIFVEGKGYKTVRQGAVAVFGEGIYVGAQMDQPLDLEILPETILTSIKLEPWVIGLVSGFNMKQSLNKTVPLKELCSSLYRSLVGLHPSSQLDEVLRVLSGHIENATVQREDWHIVRRCTAILDAGYTDFRYAKDKYLNDLKLSSRTIEKKFERHIGLSPQQYGNGIRFRMFMEELKHSKKNKSLTDLAYKHGYYDQSHLNKVFKQYWGFIPKELTSNKTFITNSQEPFRYYTI